MLAVTARCAPRPFPPGTRWPASTAPLTPWSSRRTSRQVTVAGPGAGPHLAGQGTLADIITVARGRAHHP